MNHVFHGYAPYKGDIPGRTRGSLVAFEQGETTGYGIYTLQDRGTMFIGPNEQVYEGMIVGENSRENDIDINPCKKKNVSNMRTSSSDEAMSSSKSRRSTSVCARLFSTARSAAATPRTRARADSALRNKNKNERKPVGNEIFRQVFCNFCRNVLSCR